MFVLFLCKCFVLWFILIIIVVLILILDDMKKLFLLGMMVTWILSCGNDTETSVEDSKEQVIAGKGVDPRVFDFEADVKNSSLELEMINWKAALDKRNLAEVKVIENSINRIFDGFYVKYGKVEVIGYIEFLRDFEVKGEHDGSPCTRNRDGSIYTGACSFWEKILVALSAKCSGLGAIAETEKQIDDYFNCLQGNICDTCS